MSPAASGDDDHSNTMEDASSYNRVGNLRLNWCKFSTQETDFVSNTHHLSVFPG